MTTQTEDTNMADETMGVDTKRLRELALAVTHGREAVAREFTMRVPAEPQRDADLVLMSAADELDRLRTELASVRDALRGARIHIAGEALPTRRDALAAIDAALSQVQP